MASLLGSHRFEADLLHILESALEKLSFCDVAVNIPNRDSSDGFETDVSKLTPMSRSLITM